jgi:hypothetical protein
MIMEKTAELTRIAHEHLGIETLEDRHSDSLDFHEVSVWSLRAALAAAFEAGRQSASGSTLKKGR